MNYIGKFIGVNGSSVTFELNEPFDITTARRKAGEGLIKAFIEVQDNDMISDDQRKKIFALINDICDHTGYLFDEMDQKMRYYFMAETGCDVFSLARNQVTKEFASRYIEYIIEWCFKTGIPFKYRDYHMAADITRTLFIYLKYRQCFVCGKQHADIAHVEAVGAGRNRRKIDHSQHHFMALCRDHHTEQHTIGIDTFMKKYALVPIKLTPEQIAEFKIGG
ncbi:putative HNHc nuclease [Carnobacterium maltaromaticum]|uniref:putative HNHc nuclease n=1 Tax=Carnobacterium maltaromaticum TaxID=2751 RepID=UPI00026C8A8C|nr:putative HNHc nuclease [Carnobacterium maltaromaticum]